MTNGLKEGDEIVTGSYKVLRTLRNGASVKVDNSTAKQEGRVLSDQERTGPQGRKATVRIHEQPEPVPSEEKRMATQLASLAEAQTVGSAGRVHHLHRRPVEDLRHGVGAAGPRAARSQRPHSAQRVCRHHGSVGLRQVDPDEPDRLPRYAQQGQLLAERPVGQRTRRRRTGAHPQQGNRLRLPDLQPAGARHFAAQRRTAADLRRHAGRGAPGTRPQDAGLGGHGSDA